MGSVAQIKENASRLVDYAKRNNKVIIFIGHVTKDGDIAGPKTLEHLVDCVIQLEGERESTYRLLRARKNRFGSVDEVGLLGIEATTFYIGSGSQLTINGSTLTPTQTLSGALDEFRFFHKARTIEQINTFAKKSIYSIPELKLYYKFNEPNGWFSSDENDSINRIVLDSSGNSLHSYISEQSYDPSLRGTILENQVI
jgi:hypothetical protein